MSTRVRHGWLILGATIANTAYADVSSPVPGPVRDEVIVRVLPRETLQSLSLRVFGTNRLWWRIYQWNKSVISNPDKVAVGTDLKIRLDSETLARSSKYRAANRAATAEVDAWLGEQNPPQASVHATAAPLAPAAAKLPAPTPTSLDTSPLSWMTLSLPDTIPNGRTIAASLRPAEPTVPPPPGRQLEPYWELELPK